MYIRKIQDRILEILVTALLESINLFIAVFVCLGETHFDSDKKRDPNESDNPDDLTRLQRWKYNCDNALSQRGSNALYSVDHDNVL